MRVIVDERDDHISASFGEVEEHAGQSSIGMSVLGPGRSSASGPRGLGDRGVRPPVLEVPVLG
jgi:hypothetical protein